MTKRSTKSALSGEASPFLRHGSLQPVDWMPWGEEAFARAREEDKPVLLDIGAVWCHWCHVMDRESYEDAETARIINESFVPVKVDRDARPDVDARYQRAVQLLTGQGGWPLTAFLTPNGDVYYGGTYFPPTDQFGRPSFQRVLGEVARVWRDERPRAIDAAKGISDRLEQYGQAEAQKGDVSPALIADMIEELASSFDFRYGGFGHAPKFPNAGALDLMLDHFLEAGTEWAQRIVVETLLAMGRGGIYDQLGGGFHRYTTDARWIIPHFEKMAYDNGVLLETYARAAVALDNSFFGEVANGIVGNYRDIAPELVTAGGFPASQDADHSPDDDGDYWTWTQREIRDALGDPQLVRAAELFYGIADPAGAMHLDPSRHVLFRAMEPDQLALRMQMDAGSAAQTLERIRSTLKTVRDRRPAPYVDDTLYSGWTALVASGHIAAARFLGNEQAAHAALTALERVLREGFHADRGVVHRLGDNDSGEFLEDQAYVARALVDAFELTQQPEWLEKARSIVQVLLDRFRDASGGFQDRARDARSAIPSLERPHLPIADAPSPSGNSVAALTLFRLAALTHDESYRDAGISVLRAFAGSAPRLSTSAATYVKALAWATQPVTTVVVVDDSPPDESELLRAALRVYRPRTVVRWLPPTALQPETLPVELQAMVTGDHPRAYLCAGQTCAPPVSQPEALRELMRK
jgi:uncharacterized protein YyaL (SSP411 family)